MIRPLISRPWIAISLPATGLLLCLCVPPAHAISQRTLIAPIGVAAGDYLGDSVAPAGDFNGDGWPDIIAGAQYNDAGAATAGAAFLYYGGPGADAVADLTLTGVASGDYFGHSVAGAGDVNGDGHPDVIVGAFLNDAGGSDAGRAYVYYGGPGADNTADLILTGVAAGDQFGYSVAGAGDVNGDGYADLIVGAPYNDAGGADAGRAYVFFGGATPDNTADVVLTGAAAADYFGMRVAGAGDVNGDGWADVIASAPSNDAGGADAGRAYVYYGGLAPDNAVDLTLTGAAAGDSFGASVAGVGDVNGDGWDDVIASAMLNDGGGADAGRAYVYYGGPGADGTADLTLTGAAAGDSFGSSAAGAGDVNGDGWADIIVGAYGNDAGGASAGRAYVYFGGLSPDNTADITFTGTSAYDFFGWSAAGAGDMDGDGYANVVVGAYGNDAGGSLAGRVYVYSLFPYQVISPNGGEQWVAGQPVTVRWRGHDVADLALTTSGGMSWTTIAVGIGGQEENEYTLTAPAISTTYAKVRLGYTLQTAKRSTSDASDDVFQIVLPAEPPAAATRLHLALTGAAAGDDFGWSVAGAGDVNGDGFDDVIAGAPNNDAGGASAGRAYVFYGGPDADAVADLTFTGVAANDGFGLSVAGAGDVNGDGCADLIVGAMRNDTFYVNGGAAYVYFGGPGADATPDLTLPGAAVGDYFGYAVAGAGDVNGDGCADLIVGAPANDAGGGDAGRAYVYYGGPDADAVADLTFTGAAAGDWLGCSVAGAGDVNGDGCADLIVGAYMNGAAGTSAGRAYIYHGGPDADATADLILTGEEAYDYFGCTVGGAGDVNGDGCADLVVGTYYGGPGGAGPGRAYLYLGGPDADAIPDLILNGLTDEDYLGMSVGGAGDVNGDGYADLVAGAIGSGVGGEQTGCVYLYLGGPGADAAADLILTGEAAFDNFGTCVSAAGDVNGDGFDDVIIGTPLNDAGGSEAGRVYVYDCNRYFITTPNGGETWNVGGTQIVSWLGAEPADLWLSVDGGRAWDLLQSDVGGEASNVLALRVPHAPSRFARVKVAPASALVVGSDQSDSLFTIQTSVSLLSLKAEPGPGGTVVSWSTDPGVGPEGLAGYRLYRAPAGSDGNGSRIGPELITETSYTDRDGAIAGSVYRLCAVNGLREELELGRIAPAAAFTGMRVWPSPARAGSPIRVMISAPGLSAGGLGKNLDVAIYDLQGRRVATLPAGAAEWQAGQVTLTWDGRTAAGGPAASGIYFVVARSTLPMVQARFEQRLVIAR